MLLLLSGNTDVYVRKAWHVSEVLHIDMRLKDCSLSPQTAGATSRTGRTPQGCGHGHYSCYHQPGAVCVCVLTGDSSNDSNSVKWVVLYVTKRVKERL